MNQRSERIRMDDVWINRALALREPRKMEKQDVVS
jgi:hypothetical protein